MYMGFLPPMDSFSFLSAARANLTFSVIYDLCFREWLFFKYFVRLNTRFKNIFKK